jgi:hypothetical protein
MTRISGQPERPRLLLVAVMVSALAGTAAGTYGWWRWGPLVALDALARFSL